MQAMEQNMEVIPTEEYEFLLISTISIKEALFKTI